MALPARRADLTPEEYLALDHANEHRSEYYDGVMYAMAGANLPHNRISTNLTRLIGNQLDGGPCEVFTADLRTFVRDKAYTYPDILVVCGEPELRPGQFTTVTNPLVIIEVLSESTERWDRDGKFAEYRRIASLRHYILVRQDAPGFEHHERQADDSWSRAEVAGLDGTLQIDSIGVAVSLRDVYARVFA